MKNEGLSFKVWARSMSVGLRTQTRIVRKPPSVDPRDFVLHTLEDGTTRMMPVAPYGFQAVARVGRAAGEALGQLQEPLRRVGRAFMELSGSFEPGSDFDEYLTRSLVRGPWWVRAYDHVFGWRTSPWHRHDAYAPLMKNWEHPWEDQMIDRVYQQGMRKELGLLDLGRLD